MVEQILLSSGSFDGMRETGGFGQPLHALYPQIRAVLASELGPEAAGLLAEPVVDRVNNRIDWYTEGDPDQPPVALSDLAEEQRQPMLAQVHELVERGRELAERYAASNDPRRAQLGAMLRVALGTPAETEVFLVEGRPVMIRWGFVADRPWETLADPARSPVVAPPTPNSVEPPRDVAMPEIAMPELATAAAPEQEVVVESPPLIDPSSSPEPAFPPVNISPLPVTPSHEGEGEPIADDSAKAPSSLVGEGWGEESERLPPPKLEPDPVEGAAGSSPEPESAPITSLRYVVVGSRYFWSVFALAVLLAVIAAFWWGMGRPSLSPGTGEKSGLLPDADLERALAQAQSTETELRTRLENLLVELAGRRGQCPLPAAGSDAATAAPAIREPGGSGTVPARSAVAVAGGESPRAPAIKAPIIDRATVSATEAPAADRAAVPPTEAWVSPDRTMPAVVIQPPVTIANSPDNASSLPAKPVSRVPSGMESPARTLEDVLAERAPVADAPLRQPPLAQVEPPVKAESPVRVEPPVKAEPTPEERREFTSRLSAAGAATGEITATLLWNSSGDLDLVVRCPSGQQLDYRNPAACGGALDVDANAARAGLSNRPVENAFWPAGRAGPGSYEIAVRYAPRKDEQNPRETPFQVRLIRGGQESVFKGAIRPNTVTPVTTFTVER